MNLTDSGSVRNAKTRSSVPFTKEGTEGHQRTCVDVLAGQSGLCPKPRNKIFNDNNTS